ncbi:MAG: flavin reductase family protein [Candidatus Omnitrophota bacterium]|nr:MAG: flavin reductase family protein [Candidatus Omnitrophota bacterium]
MKKMVDESKASRLVNCGMIILVTAAYKDKSTITPCAWYLPLSKKPPSVGVALAKSHFSSELIKKSQEFIINIPHWSLLEKVIVCGSVSGRQVDKFKEAHLTPQKAHSLVKTPKVDECVGNIECSLWDIKEVGDHYLFLGEVIYAEAEEDFFINDMWDTQRGDFIFHLGSRFFFKSSPSIEARK